MREAVRASLRMLSLAPDRVIWPLLAGVYRSPLGKADFSLFLVGTSGVFKTALAALCQQHFGAEMDAQALPGHFGSTGNALEEMAFVARDCLMVVDDFVPGGDGGMRVQSAAERLFRAAGNRQGRSRTTGSGRLQPSRPPQALLLATGEGVPQGRSLRARMLIVGVRSGEVDRNALNDCQSAAERGQFAAAMGSFLRWIAGRYEELERSREKQAQELRNKFSIDGAHKRTPSAVAELVSGWELWLRFAVESNAITPEEHTDLAARGRTAANELIAAQAPYQIDSDAAQRFLVLLRSALAAGDAHIAGQKNDVPQMPSLWGWKSAGQGWIPSGARIGWLSGNELYLDSRAAFEVAREMAGTERLKITEQTMRRRLHERGLLASIDGAQDASHPSAIRPTRQTRTPSQSNEPATGMRLRRPELS